MIISSPISKREIKYDVIKEIREGYTFPVEKNSPLPPKFYGFLITFTKEKPYSILKSSFSTNWDKLREELKIHTKKEIK